MKLAAIGHRLDDAVKFGTLRVWSRDGAEAAEALLRFTLAAATARHEDPRLVLRIYPPRNRQPKERRR